MSAHPPVQLRPVAVAVPSPTFAMLAATAFPDPFVQRLLAGDIPHRAAFGFGRVWAYADPTAPGVGGVVGFGTLDLSADYGWLTSGKMHPYIPLLSVMPGCGGRGYGEAIVRHLEDEAAILVRARPGCDDRPFLDVYTTSTAAIRLYERRDFRYLTTDAPLVDPADAGKLYHVMAKRVSVAD